MSHFASALSELLEAKKLTQTELSNKSGVAQPQISRWLSAEGTISDSDFEKICDVFSKPIDQARLLHARILDVLAPAASIPGKRLVQVSILGEELLHEDLAPASKVKLPPKLQRDVDTIVQNIPGNRLVRDMITSLAAHLRRP